MERHRPKPPKQLSATQLCRYLHALQQQHATLCRSLHNSPPCHPPRDTRATQTNSSEDALTGTPQRLAALERTLQQQAACVARLTAMQTCSPLAGGTPPAGLSAPNACPSPQPAQSPMYTYTPPPHTANLITPQPVVVPPCVVGHPVTTTAHHPYVPDALLQHLDAVLRSTQEEVQDDGLQAARGLQALHDKLATWQRADDGDASSVRTSLLLEQVHSMLSSTL